jgi:hypothetical protein
MFKLFNGEYNIKIVHGEFGGTKTKHNELSAINTKWTFVLTGREEYKNVLNQKNWFRP